MPVVESDEDDPELMNIWAANDEEEEGNVWREVPDDDVDVPEL